MDNPRNESLSPGTLRRLLLVVLLIGFAGTVTDLLLLAHYDGVSMSIPLALLAFAVVASLALLVRPRAGTVRLMQVAMLLLLAGGLLGMYLHFQGNREFQVEINPEIAGWELFMKVVRAHSPPAMAPGALVQFAIFGLLACFRHPSLARRSEQQ
jgi:hypothetical protein